LDITQHCLQITHENYTVEAILQTLLPDKQEITVKFEKIGHIAHMNLNNFVLDSKYLIGEVILEKNKPEIRTVVNKTEKVSDQFRVLPMEVIAGENNTIVTLDESGCQFSFDFSKVFWNSRLENEHMRLNALCKKDDILCDVFAGVGPFAIPVARKLAHVYANDLNPYCYEALLKNADLNLTKKKRQNLNVYCMDGRDFIRFCVKEVYINKGKAITHVFMNLPKIAYTFLDGFKGIFPIGSSLPLIHCYCFANEPHSDKVAVQMISSILEFPIVPELIFKVRITATTTVEYCISFRLPPEVAYHKDY